MTIRSLLVTAVALGLPAAASAEDSVTHFRMKEAHRSIQGCIAFDPSFTRIHTLTVKGDAVDLKSAGGIDEKMKMVRPGVYAASFKLAGIDLDIEADISAKPKTLVIRDRNIGCKWNGVPEA
jgi:hypothetical protein